MSKAGRKSVCWLETCCIALLCWTAAGGASVLAGQLDAGVGYALTHDSNVAKTSVNPSADWTEQLFAGFGYQERSPDLNSRLIAQVEKRHFVRNTFQDDTGFFFNGAGLWTISPRRFTWALDDVFREVQTDPTAADTPANRQKSNSLSTGPEYAFRVDPANVPVIGARYGRYYIQQSAGGNDRFTGYARWLHQVSLPTTVSLNFEATRVRFDPPALYTDVSREDLFLRYELLSLYNRQTLDVGGTRVNQYGGEQLNGHLLRYAGEISSTTRSVFRAVLIDQISDTYSDMIRGVVNPTIPTIEGDTVALPVGATNVASGDQYRSRYGEFSYRNQGESFGYNLQGYIRHIDYENLTQQNYDEKGGRLSLSWLFSLETRAYAYMQYMRRDFPGFDEVDADRNKGVGVIYKLGRTLTLTAEAGVQERQSNVPQNVYVDRRAMLLLGYSTGPMYSAQSRR